MIETDFHFDFDILSGYEESQTSCPSEMCGLIRETNRSDLWYTLDFPNPHPERRREIAVDQSFVYLTPCDFRGAVQIRMLKSIPLFQISNFYNKVS
jgi:hypothetical protein